MALQVKTKDSEQGGDILLLELSSDYGAVLLRNIFSFENDEFH